MFDTLSDSDSNEMEYKNGWKENNTDVEEYNRNSIFNVYLFC